MITRIALGIAIILLAVVRSHAQSIHVEWGYTPPSEPKVAGFNLYQEGVVVCQATDPAATAMDCEVTLTEPITNFTLTAAFNDGTESPHSAPFAFSVDAAESGQQPPKQESPYFKFGHIAPKGGRRGWVGLQ